MRTSKERPCSTCNDDDESYDLGHKRGHRKGGKSNGDRRKTSWSSLFPPSLSWSSRTSLIRMALICLVTIASQSKGSCLVGASSQVESSEMEGDDVGMVGMHALSSSSIGKPQNDGDQGSESRPNQEEASQWQDQFTHGQQSLHKEREDDIITENKGDWSHHSSNDEDDEASKHPKLHRIETVEELQDMAFLPRETDANTPDPVALWNVFIHNPECPVSQRAFPEWIHTIELMNDRYRTQLDMEFIVIPVQESTLPLLQQLEIKATPTMFFLKRQLMTTESSNDVEEESKFNLWTIHYPGPLNRFNVEDLRHWWSRLRLATVKMHPRTQISGNYVEALTVTVSNWNTLQRMILEEGWKEHPLFSMEEYQQPLPLDPLLNEQEQNWIQSMLSTTVNSQLQGALVVCQCGDVALDAKDSLDEEDYFPAVAAVLGVHHNVLFVTLQECSLETVPAGCINIHRIVEDGESSGARTLRELPRYEEMTLSQQLARLLRPPLLWWDRQSTTYIALASYHRVHAILLVDFLSDEPVQEEIVKEFNELCHSQHYGTHHSSYRDLVCLMVPSTEVRVLTTFGVDIWSQGSQQQIPMLLITNRTDTEGVQRYYLDEPQPGQMEEFVEDFWSHRLEPELHSRANFDSSLLTETPRKNSHGVAQWTAYHHQIHLSTSSSHRSATEKILSIYNPPPHTLLMVYAPTCGHCKRLNIAWNQLGRLVRHLGWDSWLQIARLDASTEEFSARGALSLPAVYYYFYGNASNSDGSTIEYTPPQKRRMVWYRRKEAGAISNPLEFLLWLADVGQGLDWNQLLEDLLHDESVTADNDDPGDDLLMSGTKDQRESRIGGDASMR